MKTEEVFMEIVEVKPWQFMVRSSSKHKDYEVIKRKDGSFFCPCASFKYNDGDCKHIKGVKAFDE